MHLQAGLHVQHVATSPSPGICRCRAGLPKGGVSPTLWQLPRHMRALCLAHGKPSAAA